MNRRERSLRFALPGLARERVAGAAADASCSSSLSLEHCRRCRRVVYGVRVTSAWNGIRVAGTATDAVIRDPWATNGRDESVENGFLQSVLLVDNLVDGAFVDQMDQLPSRCALAGDPASEPTKCQANTCGGYSD